MKKWRCTICNYIHEGDTPPATCPICKAPASKFVEVKDENSKDENKKEEAGKVEADDKTQEAEIPAVESKWTERLEFVKTMMAKHHAHPVSVHSPNGILPVVVLMFVLSATFGVVSLATAGFYNLLIVVLTLPFVIFAGYVEWEKKYNKALTSVFQIKIVAAGVATVMAVVNLLWFLMDCNVLSSSLAWLFILMNIIMVAAVGVAGHLGGKLVFKD